MHILLQTCRPVAYTLCLCRNADNTEYSGLSSKHLHLRPSEWNREYPSASPASHRGLREGPPSPNEPFLQIMLEALYCHRLKRPTWRSAAKALINRFPMPSPRETRECSWKFKGSFRRQAVTLGPTADSRYVPSNHPPRSQPVNSLHWLAGLQLEPEIVVQE